MLGKAKKKSSLFDVGNVFDLELPDDSFYAQLGRAEGLIRDEDFQDLYSETHGRPSVPPSQMATLLLLQYYDRVSDGEAVDRSAFDLRWAVALRRAAGTRLCGRSTLVEFRARLALRDGDEKIFDAILRRAREQGLLSTRPLRVLVDTRAVLGRGAVEDTYNLLARAMDLLLKVLAEADRELEAVWATRHGLAAYVRRRDTSLKGQADVDWDQPASRRRFLRQVVTDARRLLALAQAALPHLDPEPQAVVQEQVALLEQILRQDVEEPPASGKGDPELREGTAPERVPSATDADQRHGHKSHSRSFTGHKARIALDDASQLIVGADLLAGNAPDAQAATELLEQVTQRGSTVAEVVGDSAFAAGAVREAFQEKGLTLRARQPRASAPAWGISKSAFFLVFQAEQVTAVQCPAGHESRDYQERKDGTRVFSFRPWCKRCPLRHKCVQARQLKQGRTVQVHPQEQLLQAAREYQTTEEGKQTLRRRVGVEHAFARLARLGLEQARYFGRAKTRFQLVMTCAAANLRLLLRWEAAQAAASA